MLKTIIGKLKKKKKKNKSLKGFNVVVVFSFSFFFKLKRLTHNPKAELKRFWVGLDSGTK